MRTPLVAGNWKMNGTAEVAGALARGVREGVGSVGPAEVAVCPPYPYLLTVAALLEGCAVSLGGQNVCENPAGAFTGEVSAEMLVDAGCRFALVGHSERRTLYGETNARVAEKFERARAGGLEPVLCVGETLEQRESDETEAVIGAQIDAVLERCGAGALGQAVLAYEPVWAIGTGKTATPEQAQAVHAFIRARVEARDAAVAAGVRILYGGSVKASNASELFAMPDIDGGLVGGAALDAEEFIRICQHAGHSAGQQAG